MISGTPTEYSGVGHLFLGPNQVELRYEHRTSSRVAQSRGVLGEAGRGLERRREENGNSGGRRKGADLPAPAGDDPSNGPHHAGIHSDESLPICRHDGEASLGATNDK